MSLGRMLVITGVLLVALGGLVLMGEKFGLGKLPGDIRIEGEHSSFYFPVTTCILISLVGSLVLWLIRHFRS